MESTKFLRRRAHDHDLDEHTQMKRRRKREVEPEKSDSVQILGETHANGEIDPDVGHCPDDHQPVNLPKRLLVNGGCGRTGATGAYGNGARYAAANVGRGKERGLNGVQRGDSNSVVPDLPPNPRESERMLFVQQWINNIRLDLPLWVQTSLTRIAPVTSPDCFPAEDESVTCDPSAHRDGTTIPDRTQLSPHEPRVMLGGPSAHHLAQSLDYSGMHQQQPNSPHCPSSSAANTLGMLGPRFPNTPGQQQQQPPPHQTYLPSAAPHAYRPSAHANGQLINSPGHINPGQSQIPYQSNSLGVLHTREPGKGKCNEIEPAPVGRLFDDVETQLVVKLFRDYFTKGSCPILSEVRRRTANTVLESRRTAISIRAKIKRLQTSGRWTDYAGI